MTVCALPRPLFPVSWVAGTQGTCLRSDFSYHGCSPRNADADGNLLHGLRRPTLTLIYPYALVGVPDLIPPWSSRLKPNTLGESAWFVLKLWFARKAPFSLSTATSASTHRIEGLATRTILAVRRREMPCRNVELMPEDRGQPSCVCLPGIFPQRFRGKDDQVRRMHPIPDRHSASRQTVRGD